MPVLLNILAILPGLIICWYIYQLDKYEKESKPQLILCFVLGMLATGPVYYLERSLHNVDAYISGDLALLLSSFLVVGLGEELSKFIAFLFYVYRHLYLLNNYVRNPVKYLQCPNFRQRICSGRISATLFLPFFCRLF